jgi:hypothetical protein
VCLEATLKGDYQNMEEASNMPSNETIEIMEENVEETYHSPSKLIRISTWANTISWLILALFIILTGGRIYTDGQQILQAFQQSGGQLPWIQVVLFVADRLSSSLFVGLFYFLVLQAVSEGINILMDIHEGLTQR